MVYSGPFHAKLVSYSTQLSMKFQWLINVKWGKMKIFLALQLSDVVCMMLMNVRMPSNVGILTFMCMIKFMLS